MAITVRQTVTGVASTAGANVTLTYTSAQAGDVAYVFGGFSTAGAANPGISTAGYTNIYANNTTAAKRFGVWRKVLTASEAGPVCLGSGTAGDGVVYGAVILAGVDTNVFEDTLYKEFVSAAAIPNAAAILPNRDACAILIAACNAINDSTQGTVTNYTLGTGNAAATRPYSMGYGSRILATGKGASEDPAAWNAWTSGNCIAVTLAIVSSGASQATNFADSSPTFDVPEIIPSNRVLVATSFAVGAWSVAEQPYTIGSDDGLGTDPAGSWKPYTMPAAPPWAVDNVAVASPVLDAAVLTQQHVLTATALAVGVPTLDQGVLLQTHVLPIAAPIAVGVPTRTTPALAQGHVLTATAIATAPYTIGVPAMASGVAVSATNLAVTVPPVIGAPAMGVIVNATATSFVDSSPTLGAGAFGRNILAPAFVDGLPILDTPVIAQNNILTPISVVDAIPVFGTPALAISVNMTGIAAASGVPVIGTPAMAVIVNATATPLAASAPALGTGAYGRVIPAVGAVSGLPVLAQPTLVINALPFFAANVATGIPVFGQPTTAIIVNATATPLAPSPPVLAQLTLAQTHVLLPTSVAIAIPTFSAAAASIVVSMVATSISVSPPTCGTPTLAAIANPQAGSISVAGPIIGTPNMVPIILLSAANLATAPPLEAAATVVQKQVLAAIAVATTVPVIGQPAFGQAHAPVANNLAVSPPTSDAPLFVQTFRDLVLGDRVLDYGLDVLRTEANKVLALTTAPNTYAEAIALSVGENAATFGAPQANGSGRKISSSAVVNGTVTGTGVVSRWAVVDTVNSRLLAHGDITGDDQVFPGVSWTLAPIVIIQPGA